MKLLMLFVDGFEDVEAIGTLDILRRGGEDVTCASLMGRRNIVTKLGNVLTIDALIEEVNEKEYDGLIIPGGPGSFKIMPTLPIVEQLIRSFADSKRLVAAICAAPHLVGKLGYYKDKSFTVHPGFEDKVIGGTYLREKGVVRDGDFITGKSMFYSIEFGLAIYEYYHGVEAKNKLMKACMGE